MNYFQLMISDNEIVELLLYGSKKFNFQQNCSQFYQNLLLNSFLNQKDLMDQCYSKRKYTPLLLFFQSHIYICLHSAVVLFIMTKHYVYLGLREHNHIYIFFSIVFYHFLFLTALLLLLIAYKVLCLAFFCIFQSDFVVFNVVCKISVYVNYLTEKTKLKFLLLCQLRMFRMFFSFKANYFLHIDFRYTILQLLHIHMKNYWFHINDVVYHSFVGYPVCGVVLDEVFLFLCWQLA